MASLIYAPEVRVHIRTAPTSRGKGKIIDVSEDISSGSITRILNGISSANLSLLNQNRKYDQMFGPMDSIVIYLRRIKTVLKFAGYLDGTPLWGAEPGSVNLTASCSLKRLANFYWDPGSTQGAALLSQTDASASKMEDGGLAQRAINVLTEVAQWPKAQIHIARVPTGWTDMVSSIADKLVANAEAASMASVIGTGSWVGGTNPVGSLSSSTTGIGPGTGTMPATSGKCSEFGGPGGGAYGNFALTGESGTHPRDGWYCLPEGSLVYTEAGPRRIEQVEVGQMVWSTEDDKPRLAAVTGKINTGTKSIIEVKTRGRSLRCTPDHRVLILTREGTRKTRREVCTEWVRAGDLVRGDVLVALSGVDRGASAAEPSPQQAMVAGWMVADGSRGDYRANTDGTYGSGRTRWALCLNERERPTKVAFLRDQGYAVSDAPDRCCVGFRALDLHPWLSEVMRHKSPDRYVPDWVWTASPTIQTAFLEGFISGDGSTGQPLTQGTTQIALTSERLVRELRVLAQMLGWGTGNVGSYEPRSGFANGKRIWRFVCYRAEAWGSVPSSYSRHDLEMSRGLRGQTVVSIQQAGEAECWDLEVDGPASFVAEGVVVHNCAMRWPYVTDTLLPAKGVDVQKAKAWWANRHILVVNPKNNKAVVVRAADWGPNINTGRVIDLAPQALHALGAATDDTLHMGFAPAGSSLGPVSKADAGLGSTLAATVPTSGKGAGAIHSGWGNIGDASNMVTAHAGGCTFVVNRIAKTNFEGFVNDLVSQLGYHPKVIGGFRSSGGIGGPMNHGYGAAIDIDPATNPYFGTPPPKGSKRYSLPGPPAIIQLARKWGLYWGGEYNHSKDYMHFEVIGAPFTPNPNTSAYGPNIKGGGATFVAKWTPPIHKPPGFTITAHFGDGGSHWANGHSGTDFACPSGTPIYPVGPGTVHLKDYSAADYGNYVTIDHGNNVYTLYGHMEAPALVNPGDQVTQSTIIGRVGQTGNATGPHVHVEIRKGADTYNAALASGGIDKYVLGGPNRSSPPSGTQQAQGNFSSPSQGNAGLDTAQIGQGLFNFWQFTQNLPTQEGVTLGGYRALMNDVPVLQTVGQILNAGLRDFCSAPNGDFISWFPDYFGHFGQIGKMVVTPLEIQQENGPPTIGWDDTNLKTHQFVAASTSAFAADASTIVPMSTTAGIASIEFPELMMALLNISRTEATNLRDEYLQRMGARPEFTPMDQISGHRQEFFFACYLFQQNWSAQYQATVNLTFMPELYPGMMLCLPDYGIQGYIRETTDSWDMSGGGFSTSVSCAPWSSIGKNGPDGLPRGAAL